jgi:ribonuclease-3
MGTKQQDHINHSALTTWFWNDVYSPELKLEDFLDKFSKVSEISQLQDQINYQFQNPLHLLNALSHRSFIHEVNAFEVDSYETLEFLGDSFLNYFVSKNLKNNLSHLSEGQWSKLRGAIVNTTSLHDMAVFFDLPRFLLTGRGQVTHQETQKHKIYADMIEALVGAVISDNDEVAAWNFLSGLFEKYQNDTGINFWDENLLTNFDFKSQLQEMIMSELKTTPIYDSKEVDQSFHIVCRVGQQELGSLTHKSKKIGQKELAKQILENKSELIEKLNKEKQNAQ